MTSPGSPPAAGSRQEAEGPFRPGSRRGGTLALLAAMWDGFCLRCPSCRRGPIYKSLLEMHPACPACGAPFERDNEGDFLGAMVTAYSLTVVFGAVLTVLLYVFTRLPIATQMLIVGGASLTFLLVFYRNLKGVWVAVLLALLRWMK
ncbi:MAG: hypothetical protein CW345_05880 [Firmicutes bacterium]|nr:hypothetical protein [Bacillota bacterium]MBO2521314.1 hypothetical protein [Bacillota bacterium]